jgi:hypothetical protein
MPSATVVAARSGRRAPWSGPQRGFQTPPQCAPPTHRPLTSAGSRQPDLESLSRAVSSLPRRRADLGPLRRPRAVAQPGTCSRCGQMQRAVSAGVALRGSSTFITWALVMSLQRQVAHHRLGELVQGRRPLRRVLGVAPALLAVPVRDAQTRAPTPRARRGHLERQSVDATHAPASRTVRAAHMQRQAVPGCARQRLAPYLPPVDAGCVRKCAGSTATEQVPNCQ